MVAQEQFPASPLPAEMVHEIDVSDEVRLLETDDVPILIDSHRRSSPGDPAREAHDSDDPAPRMSRSRTNPNHRRRRHHQPAARGPLGAIGLTPALARHSRATQRRVADRSMGSPVSRTTSLANSHRS